MTARLEAAVPAVARATRRARWDLRRNCSLTPAQTCRWYAATAATGLALGGASLLCGAGIIAAFFLCEVIGLTVALVVYARHATDREVVELEGRGLNIARFEGGDVQRVCINLDQTPVRVAESREGIELCHGSRVLAVLGSHLGADARRRAARALAQGVRP